MNEFLENLKRQAQENPMAALGVAAVVMTAITKFVVEGVNSRAWAKEVRRRQRKDARR